MNEHGDAHCPADGADGHSVNSSAERTKGRLVLIGFIGLCLLAIAYVVGAANSDSPANESPAGAGAHALDAECSPCAS